MYTYLSYTGKDLDTVRAFSSTQRSLSLSDSLKQLDSYNCTPYILLVNLNRKYFNCRQNGEVSSPAHIFCSTCNNFVPTGSAILPKSQKLGKLPVKNTIPRNGHASPVFYT